VNDYKTEDYKEVANNLDIVFDTLGNDYTFDAFEIIKEGGKVTTIVVHLTKKQQSKWNERL
jgi:NADPH:quinone reductase-like Zn-dependent oxidoreductase